ncbi:MAG: ImmA/IrrE family metallo-endopeptidase [Acidobacteria bacterium]|nr:ImmA/IrrE family metallo-endopeptidase [Acidobacteriota bacterium]
MSFDRTFFATKLREYRGQFLLTEANVAKDTGIAEGRVRALEAGEVNPTGDEILILADFFRCDYRFFISNERVAPFKQTGELFRRHGEAFSADDRRAIQEFLYLCECEAFLMQELSVPIKAPFTFHKQGTYLKGHGIEAAAGLREYLGYTPRHAIPNVFADLRSLGLHVFRRELANRQISGVFLRHPTAGPCVLVNYSEDVFRQQFTALHETGHAFLDDGNEVVVSFATWSRDDLIEVRADAFASHVLISPALLAELPDPRKWNSDDLVRWALKLHVNSQTLLRSLRDAGRLTREEAYERRSWRVPVSKKVDPELEGLSGMSLERRQALLKRGLSSYYVQLCFGALHADRITAARAAEMLLTDLDGLAAVASLFNIDVYA